MAQGKPGRALARAGWIACVVGLTCAPYLVARAKAPPGSSFNWILPPYPDDALAYLAWVKQAALGAWLFKLKLTALPQRAVLFQPFFLVAGLICRATGAWPGLVLFWLRALGVAAFLLALERFVRRLPLSLGARRLALALVSVSSGWGFLQAWGLLRSPAGSPSDLWLVDCNTLWSLTWNPLFPFALALLVVIIDLCGDERPSGRKPAAAGALTSLLALLHPYDAGIVGVVVAILALRRPRGGARDWLVFAAAAAPGVLYEAWAARAPILAGHARLGAMPSPAVSDLVWGFGFVGVLAVAGVAVLARRKAMRGFAPVLAWAGGALAAAYFPVWFQRKFLFGVHLPLCVLAAVGADAALARLRGRGAYAACGAALVLLTVPTQVANVGRVAALLRASADAELYYVEPELRGAFAALSSAGRPDDVVFAAPDVLALLVPVWTGKSSASGHWAQSVGAEGVREAVFGALSPAAPLDARARRERLLGAGIRFLLFDETLRSAAGGGVPPWLSAHARPLFNGQRFQAYDLGDPGERSRGPAASGPDTRRGG